MKIIGLVGEKGSGKQTFVNYLKEISPNLQLRQVRFSDILAATLMMWDIPITRSNLQKLAVIMNDTFGAQTLANAAKFSLEGDNADIIILDGVRRKGETEFVRSFKDNILIYITANSDLRYQRLRKRSEKVGEVGLTLEQFMEEEKSKAESEIPVISKTADIKIENNGTLEGFKQEIKSLNLLSNF